MSVTINMDFFLLMIYNEIYNKNTAFSFRKIKIEKEKMVEILTVLSVNFEFPTVVDFGSVFHCQWRKHRIGSTNTMFS